MDLCPLWEKWIRRPLCHALDWKKKEGTPSVLGRCLYGRDSQWKMSTKPKSAVRTELLSIYAYDLCMFQVKSGPLPSEFTFSLAYGYLVFTASHACHHVIVLLLLTQMLPLTSHLYPCFREERATY